jgi:hypothetical protein
MRKSECNRNAPEIYWRATNVAIFLLCKMSKSKKASALGMKPIS